MALILLLLIDHNAISCQKWPSVKRKRTHAWRNIPFQIASNEQTNKRADKLRISDAYVTALRLYINARCDDDALLSLELYLSDRRKVTRLHSKAGASCLLNSRSSKGMNAPSNFNLDDSRHSRNMARSMHRIGRNRRCHHSRVGNDGGGLRFLTWISGFNKNALSLQDSALLNGRTSRFCILKCHKGIASVSSVAYLAVHTLRQSVIAQRTDNISTDEGSISLGCRLFLRGWARKRRMLLRRQQVECQRGDER